MASKSRSYLQVHETIELTQRGLTVWAYTKRGKYLGRVEINNAGLALGLEPAHQVDLDDWETMVDTNIKGLMYCTRFILPGMVARNRGHIVNISSLAGKNTFAGGGIYCAGYSETTITNSTIQRCPSTQRKTAE